MSRILRGNSLVFYKLQGLPYFRNTKLILVSQGTRDCIVIAIVSWPIADSADFIGLVLKNKGTKISIQKGDWVSASLVDGIFTYRQIRPSLLDRYKGGLSSMFNQQAC